MSLQEELEHQCQNQDSTMYDCMKNIKPVPEQNTKQSAIPNGRT